MAGSNEARETSAARRLVNPAPLSRLPTLGAMTPTLTTADGLALHVHRWPRPEAKGTVLIVHGLGEHGGRYAHVAAQLNAWGWAGIAYDHRGRGRSAGARGRIARDDALLEDLAAVIDAARAAHPGRLLLLGHSMGG